MFSACEFLGLKPRFLRRSCVRGLWLRPLPPQLRILRRAPATAGRSWQAMGWTLRVEGHLQGVLGQRTPPNRSLVEDESADLLLHIYLQPIEQCMGSMHTGADVDKRPLEHHVRYCGGSEPTRSLPAHSKKQATNFHPIRTAGNPPHHFDRRMWSWRNPPWCRTPRNCGFLGERPQLRVHRGMRWDGPCL